ncbi:1-phosphofructokinase [Sediminihabitans luteus]|uniref:1-phosphofructokinase n=1 Tax=Sediminihabitans luteus TaxID=1138585 RepID=A0A2M9D098_9CELL|nr:PfkB family carbohydrate kinase [Sediminihabitans luteus]PJJ77589.1 1-phosphofructokinase [Sediminihabitans luteus]GII98489.1 1-phosphofructokinase [Sediminihabitans luteus]
MSSEPPRRAPSTPATAPAEPARTPRVCVLAVTPQLTVEIEPSGPTESTPEVHVHPGGQGLWLARMAYSLGAEVVVCGPFGGETGSVAAHLARAENLELRPTTTAGNGAYVHDRTDGVRREIALMPPRPLDRHELDDLYGTVLVSALEADVCIVTGAEPAVGVPASFFGRLVRDLHASDKLTVADLSGRQAAAAASAPGAVLKISHEELVDGGFSADDSLDALRAAGRALLDGGPRAVVVSRAEKPSLLLTADTAHLVTTPRITTVDHRGAGDSMTAGIAVGLGRGLALPDAVRLGAAAGALNVTRRGLGTGRRDQIERFARRVSVRELT